MKRAIFLFPLAIAAFGTAALAFSSASVSEPGEQTLNGAAETAEKPGSGALDGMTFAGQLGPSGAPADVDDQWVFENGMFVSRECERRCNYPPRAYYSRQVRGATEFMSVTQCPDKDATIVWRGTVEGRSIKGVATWTVERWYWTIEKTFAFEGELTASPQPLASDQPSQ